MEQGRPDAFISLVTGASRSITRLKSGYMSDYGLGSTHTMCLRRLSMSDGGLTRTQLADGCGLDKAQVSRIIAELCEKGCVSEGRTKSGYKRKITLTDEGRLIADNIGKTMSELTEYISSDIPRDQLEIFYRVFGEICENLKSSEQIFLKNDSNNERK